MTVPDRDTFLRAASHRSLPSSIRATQVPHLRQGKTWLLVVHGAVNSAGRPGRRMSEQRRAG
jgi:hypothetical protein